MVECIYPLPLNRSTSEQLTSELIHKYWLYIKLHFKFKLKYNPRVFDYNNVICIYYDDFWFRITINYKINIRKVNNYIDEEFVYKRLSEIMGIILEYYPNIYKNKLSKCIQKIMADKTL